MSLVFQTFNCVSESSSCRAYEVLTSDRKSYIWKVPPNVSLDLTVGDPDLKVKLNQDVNSVTFSMMVLIMLNMHIYEVICVILLVFKTSFFIVN